MKLTKRIASIRAWPEDRKQKTLSELLRIISLPKHHTVVKCSAFAAQVSEAGRQFDLMGEAEIRFILWG
jgi:hypothetical protein